jgi:hypothetical protein
MTMFLFNALKQRFPNYIYLWLSTLLMNNQTDQRHNELCVRIDINEHRKFDSKFWLGKNADIAYR